LKGILGEFKEFISHGNLVELAVAVVIGTAFAALIRSFVDNLITPIIAAIFGKPSFASLSFTINNSTFLYGDFLNAVITFVTIAAAIFFLVVKPLNALAARRAAGAPTESPTTRSCPECLSEIPVAARRCAHCTSQVATA
jgi:large conductance mechanosensitive channel